MKYDKLNKTERTALWLLCFGFLIISFFFSILPDYEVMSKFKRNNNIIIGSLDNNIIYSEAKTAFHRKKFRTFDNSSNSFLNTNDLSKHNALQINTTKSKLGYSSFESGAFANQKNKKESKTNYSSAENLLLASMSGKSVREEVMLSSSGSVSSQLPMMYQPFAAPNAVTVAADISGGGDPGFSPYGAPLSVGSGLLITIFFGICYLFFQREYQKRQMND